MPQELEEPLVSSSSSTKWSVARVVGELRGLYLKHDKFVVAAVGVGTAVLLYAVGVVGFVVWLWNLLITALVWFAVLTLVAQFLIQLMTKAVKNKIETIDQEILGVDVELDIDVDLFHGIVVIKNFKVYNPDTYKATYAMKAGLIKVDMNLSKLLLSFGKHVEIEELVIEGLSAIIEVAGLLAGKSNVQCIMDNMDAYMGAQAAQAIGADVNPDERSDIEAIYSFWHKQNKEHTFHLLPAWEGEQVGDVVFYAAPKELPGTKPVYDWWHRWHKEHTFHFEPSWGNERQNNICFYAWPEQVEGTEPVYDFWHKENKEHTFHFEPPWPMERKGSHQFYAYRSDPHGKAHLITEAEPRLLPVFDFWHNGHSEHTFHFAPPWGGERQNKVSFYAYDKQFPGTEPVYDYWHPKDKEHTFHMGDPWPNEEKRSVNFYAFKEQQPGTEPVYDFWHHKNKEHTFHMGEPWDGETKGNIQFYAYRVNPSAIEVSLRRVAVTNVEVKLATQMVGLSGAIQPIKYDNFSEQFNAHGLQDVTYILLRSLTSMAINRGA